MSDVTGPACPECGREVRWHVLSSGFVIGRCPVCVDPASAELHDAVEEVLARHLTSDRWKLSENPDDADDDEANGWVEPARDALARVMQESLLPRWDNNAAAAEADFEDFRDYCLWQAMLDLARSQEGAYQCSCGCSDEVDSA